jgi:hypothetical protein
MTTPYRPIDQVCELLRAAFGGGMEVVRARVLGDDGEWHDIDPDPDGVTRVRWNFDVRRNLNREDADG